MGRTYNNTHYENDDEGFPWFGVIFALVIIGLFLLLLAKGANVAEERERYLQTLTEEGQCLRYADWRQNRVPVKCLKYFLADKPSDHD